MVIVRPNGNNLLIQFFQMKEIPPNGVPKCNISLIFIAETENASTLTFSIDGKFNSSDISQVSCKAKVSVTLKSDEIYSVLVM